MRGEIVIAVNDRVLITSTEDKLVIRCVYLSLPGSHGSRDVLAGKETSIVDTGSRGVDTWNAILVISPVEGAAGGVSFVRNFDYLREFLFLFYS